METLPDENLLVDIEAEAAEMTRHAGEILLGHFGTDIEVEYKDEKKQRDPVTKADTESQEYLCSSISRSFPDHGIVGEEGPKEEDEPVKDFLWVLDPLDGTTNFINGLPIYAVSVGVLHRGTPVAGAIFIPWPGGNGGVVLHARKGGGAWMDGERISIVPEGTGSEGPEPNRLVGLPGSFGASFKIGKGLRRRVGEPRVTGSIAYELAMAAREVFQYVVIGGPRIWDVAAGVLIVAEAGSLVMVRPRGARRWEPLTCLGPSWEQRRPTEKEVRSWVGSLIVGNKTAVPVVAANLGRRISFSARVARLLPRRAKRER